jgi:hypothetical protein
MPTLFGSDSMHRERVPGHILYVSVHLDCVNVVTQTIARVFRGQAIVETAPAELVTA